MKKDRENFNYTCKGCNVTAPAEPANNEEPSNVTAPTLSANSETTRVVFFRFVMTFILTKFVDLIVKLFVF